MRLANLYTVPVLLFSSGLLARAEVAQTPAVEHRVTVEVFSDFQCPYCGRFAPALRELERKGIDGIKNGNPVQELPFELSSVRPTCRPGGAGRRRAGQILGDA